jgi:hypothetical protein
VIIRAGKTHIDDYHDVNDNAVQAVSALLFPTDSNFNE